MKNKTSPAKLLSLPLMIVAAMVLALSVQAQSPFFKAVTNLNPVAYWPLQETVLPPAADVEPNLGSLGAVANAYYSSTNVFKGVPGIPSGDSDPAVNMQSALAGAFLAVPLTGSGVTLPAGPFTVEVWIYPTNTSASTIIAQTGLAGSGGLNGGPNSAGWSLNLGYVPSLNSTIAATVSFHVYNGVGSSGGAEATFTQPGFGLNNWYHIVAVYDGVNAVVYVNDTTNTPVIAAIPMSGTQARDTWDELTIGCGRGLNNNKFGGYLDEPAIYNYALSASRIQVHYNTGTSESGGYQAAVTADSPYMYWRMDAPAYTTPAASAYPTALNYGSGASINGIYLSGTTPGMAGPALSGFGSPSYACAFNGIGTDSTNAIPIATNGVVYATNTAAETGVIITNLLTSMNQNISNMSFACWFKLNPSDNHRDALVGHSDSGWRTSINAGNATGNSGKGSDMTSPFTYNDGNWHFVTVVYTNSNVRLNTTNWLGTNYLYVDGLLVQSAFNSNGTPVGVLTNISIGVPPDHWRTGAGNTYEDQVTAGSIAHVAFFTNALTPAQVVNLYTNATGGALPVPVITSQPFPFPSVRPYTGGPGTFLFEAVVATGNPPLSYQWYFNTSSNYAGATELVDNVTHYTNSMTSQLTVTNLTDGDSGYYYAVVTDGFGGSVTSAIVNVQVNTQPIVASQSPTGPFTLYAGQNDTLSVTATGETNGLAYQWLTNGAADTTAGTAAAYALAGVQLAQSGETFKCIVTNLSGSVTSAVATLTVLPFPAALTNQSYSSNVLALNPSGYWPLHEVAAAAVGDVETNLGTLGNLANGYYVDWTQPSGSNVLHQVGGALAYDSDPAVLFNNAPDTGSPGYLMIPRTSPATTLTAPFTLECWVKPLNTGFGDIISEGAFGTSSGDGSRYGVRMAWGTGGSSPTESSDFLFYIGQGTSANASWPSSGTPGANLPIGQWYHIVLVTADGTNWTFYVNGNVHYTFSIPMATDIGDPLAVATGLWESTGPQRAFDGAIDEVAVYSSALQQTDVSTHYNDGVNGPAGQYKTDVESLNPIVYLRMNGPTYTPPALGSWPAATNFGTVAVNGVYSPGSIPGAMTGPNSGGTSSKNVMPGSGMSSYVDLGNNAAYNPSGATAYSFSAWFRGNPTDQRSTNTIISRSDNSFRAVLNASGKLVARLGTNDIVSSATFNDGNWHQFVATFTGTNATYASTNTGVLGVGTLYADGVQVGQSLSFAAPGASSVDVMVGNDAGYTNNPLGMGRAFAGQICEAAYWNGVVLSGAQVANLYSASELVPVITKQPVSASVNANSAFTNSVAAAFGSGTYTYQWYRNNQPLPIGGQVNLPNTATNAILIINPVQGSDASSDYYVVVSNAGGSITSSVVSLTVFTQPVFSSEPILQTLTNNILLFSNATPTFSVSTIGAQPVYYQWFTNGVAATAGTIGLTNYTLSPIQLGGGVTNFYCVATNFVGGTTNTPVSITGIPAPTAPYPVAVMVDNPQNYWRLNESNVDGYNSGTLADDYWGGKNGIYTNTILGLQGYNTTTDPLETSAYFGYDTSQDSDAYGINGVDFSTPTNGNANFSVEAWVNAPPQTSDAGIVSKGYGGGGEQFDLDTGSQSDATNGFRFFVRDASGATHLANSSLVPSSGSWYHLVGVCNETSGVVTLYINGGAAGSATITPGSGILYSPRSVLIGSRPSNSTTNRNDFQFSGQVDDVAVYNYALSASQVANHYAASGQPPYFTQLPSAAITTNGSATLTLPAAATGTPPLSYGWVDVGNGTNISGGSTNGPLLNASLTTGSLPASWNNDTLELSVTNAYGTTNFIVALTLFTNAPQLTVDLLPQVIVPTGKVYTYSVSAAGPQPYSYQWYHVTSPVSNATNSTFAATGGSPGSSTTYFVVVTNAFGATTSTISTFTSIALPSNTFATTVLGLSPVGYWPLQETNPPAAATMETNYGTLGRLGNAYYSATNASVITFDQTGALTGDTDPAATFGNVGQVSYAFVPRLSPALTIQAPFTLEVWVNTANTTYGVMIGEGGGSGLNGAATFGGFQTGMGAVSGLEVPQMQYYTGGNNTFNQFNGPVNEPSGTWYHVVSTYDGNNSITYVDGVQVDTGTTANVPDGSGAPLCIGNSKWDFSANGPTRQLSALLDEVAVYTNVLSATRIAAHYNSGIDPTDNGAYETNVLADQPMLYYRMDCAGYTNTPEVECPIAVNYGSASPNGAYLSGIVPGGLQGPTNSLLGTNSVAAPINGVVSCVDAGYDPSFNPTGTQAFTAVTWFRTYPSDDRLQTMMGHGTNWALNLDGTSGHVVWSLSNGSVTSTNLLNDDNWHCVAGVYNGTTSYLYVDGVLNNSATVSGGLVGEPSANLYLGGDSDYVLVGNNERYFSGALAQAALFSSPLTATQIQQLFTASVTPTISITAAGGSVTITYTGRLLSSTGIAGPYSAVAGAAFATSPTQYIVSPADAQLFYRTSSQ